MFLSGYCGRLAARYTMSVVVHAYIQYPRCSNVNDIASDTVIQGVHVRGDSNRWSEVLRIQSTASGSGMMLMSQYSTLGDLYQRGMRSILW